MEGIHTNPDDASWYHSTQFLLHQNSKVICGDFNPEVTTQRGIGEFWDKNVKPQITAIGVSASYVGFFERSGSPGGAMDLLVRLGLPDLSTTDNLAEKLEKFITQFLRVTWPEAGVITGLGERAGVVTLVPDNGLAEFDSTTYYSSI